MNKKMKPQPHNIVTATAEQLSKDKMALAIVSVIIGSIIYSLAVVWIFAPGGLISSGVTGISQLLQKIIQQISTYNIPLAFILGGFNIPLFLIGYRFVSKRFAFLTLLSIAVQLVSTYIFEKLILVDGVTITIINFVPEFANNRLLLAIIGGGLAGLGAGICLRFGGSTGGIDIIANALVVRKNSSFTKPSFIIDFVIVFLAGFSFTGGISYELDDCIYTLIRLFAYYAVIDAIYDIYHPMCIRIITKNPEPIKKYLFEKIYHGITEYPAKGSYSNENETVLEIIASAYEVEDYIAVARYYDEHAFVVVTQVRKVKGNFISKTII